MGLGRWAKRELWRMPQWRDLLLVLAAAAFALQTWLVFYSPDPITYPIQPVPVETKRLKATDPFIYQVTRCAAVDQAVVTSVHLVRLADGVRIVMPNGSHLIPAGCETRRIILENFLLPGLTPGWYQFEGVSSARGRWRSVDILWVTEPFEVVP